MEGTTHAATGLLLGAGVGLLTGTAHAHGAALGANIGRDLLYGFVTAGAALLPDADHPKASFAYSAGPLSHGISHLVAVLAGGHRQGTHSFAGIGAVIFVTELLGVWLYPNRYALVGLAVLLALCVTAGLKATGFARHGLGAVLVGGVLAAAAVTYVRADLWWLVALGMALHILEDEFTGHGCALLWPILNKRIGGDGRQPARGRASGRRPRSEFQKAKARAARGPAAPKPAARPKGRTAQGPKLMCPGCWVDDHEECKGQGCGCPLPAKAHPNRVTARKAAPTAQRPALPPAEEDIPPY